MRVMQNEAVVGDVVGCLRMRSCKARHRKCRVSLASSLPSATGSTVVVIKDVGERVKNKEEGTMEGQLKKDCKGRAVTCA